jgi:hypothetical protein
VGDVPALLLVAGALALLTPRAAVRTETTDLGIRRVA